MKTEGIDWETSNGGPRAEITNMNGKGHRTDGRKVNGDLQNRGRNDLDEKRSGCHCFCVRKISNGIVWTLETVFYKVGFFVALNPIKTIAACLIVCGGMGAGLVKWHEESNYVKVWLPRGSRMYDEYYWVQRHFPVAARYEFVIVENDNVLTSKSINAIMDIYVKSSYFKTEDGKTLDSLCIKSGPVCRVNSILELWAYNETVIRSLSTSEILQTVNTDNLISPLYQNELNVETILGGVTRDDNGTITGAGATTMLWFLEKNNSLHESVMDWELQLINLVNDEGHNDLKHIYIYTARTFDDEGMGAVSNDIGLLTAGFSIVLVYVTVTIGSYSMIHHKILLAFAGLLSIGFSIVFTLGIGFVTGIMYGVIHQILPFMLLGIGVDDMFVIVEAYKRLTPQQLQLPVEERIALTLRHAGVSITVTSITDIVAFGIGASTVIPALSTFCIYATIGVFALYILQATYFVACLTLDQRRLDANRNACILCYVHKDDYKPNKYYRFSVQNFFFKKIWGPLLTKFPTKIIVILIAMGVAGVNIWSFTKLKHDFDYKQYLPSDSYSLDYVDADRKYFPEDGTFVLVYCEYMSLHQLDAKDQRQNDCDTMLSRHIATLPRLTLVWHALLAGTIFFLFVDNIDYYGNKDRLKELMTGLSEMQSIQTDSVDFWLLGFTRWLNTTPHLNMTGQLNEDKFPSTPKSFYSLLQGFLFSKEGRGYLRYIKVDNLMNISNIQASAATFRHTKFDSSPEHIRAMDDARSFIDSFTFSGGGTCFPYNDRQYMWNETNKVLKSELYRNLLIAAVCVFFVTLILIANLWTSILVFICVVCTVIDVAGTLQFWGVTIDTASSVLLILCFGLAVDYSAHVGHSFMTVIGTKNERARETLIVIGPAVFSGGLSTFLAFLLLANSSSYGFILFFRIFTSVVAFGLFHGLTFLPVVLSLIGPKPYGTSVSALELKQYTDLAYSNDNIAMQDLRKTKVVHINGHGHIRNGFPRSTSQVNEGFNEIMDNENSLSQEYSDSYYEQLSNGTMVRIPKPDYSPNLSQRRVSNSSIIPVPGPAEDYT